MVDTPAAQRGWTRKNLAHSSARRGPMMLLVGLVVGSLMAVSGCRTPYDSGLSAYAEGNYQQAQKHAQSALDEQPDSPARNLLMAQTLVAQKAYRDAQPYAEKAAEADTAPAEAYRMVGKVYWELDQPAQAANAWRTARKKHPGAVSNTDFKRALARTIDSAMNLHDFGDALELRDELAGIAPDHPAVRPGPIRRNRQKLARALTQAGQFEEAIDLYGQLSRDHPDHGEYDRARGRLLIKLDRLSPAIEAFEAYVGRADDADRLGRQFEIAQLARNNDAPVVAIHFWEAALNQMSDPATFRRAKLHLTLANAYWNTDHSKSARHQIDAYLADMTKLRGLPLEADVFVTAADIAAGHDEASYARNLLQRGLTKAPPSWNLAAKLASQYARRARTGDMEDVLQTYVERAGDSAAASRRVAQWASDRRNYSLAEHFLNRVARHNDADPVVWWELAVNYSALGRLSKLDHALDMYLDPPTDFRLAKAAQLYQKHRMYEQAEQVLLLGRHLEPANFRTTERLAELYSDWGKPAKLKRVYDQYLQAIEPDPGDYATIGDHFKRRSKLKQALPYYKKAARAGMAKAWLDVADIYRPQGRNLDMKHALEAYLDSSNHTPSALRHVLSRYRRAGMAPETIAVFEELIEGDPTAFNYYRGLSKLYFDQSREQDAIDLWTDYLAAADQPFAALERISRWVRRHGKPQWALSIYRRLLDRGDADPRLYRLVGDTYLSIDQHRRRYGPNGRASSRVSAPKRRAKHFYELYLDRTDPQRTQLADFADSMRRQKMWGIAARAYHRLSDQEAPTSKLWVNYAEVLLNMGRVREAERMLTSYYKAGHQKMKDARKVAEMLYKRNRFQAAKPYLNKMFNSERPSYVQQAFQRLASIYVHNDRSQKLTRLITAFLDRAQNPTKARQQILHNLQSSGMYAEAAAQIDQIRSFQGDVLGFQWGKNLFKAGQRNQATTAFGKYARQNSYPGDAWVTVGDFYTNHGAGELAEQAYRSAVAAAPDNGKTHRALGEFLILDGQVKSGRRAMALARKKAAAGQRVKIDRKEVDALKAIGRSRLARDAAEQALPTAGANKDAFERVVFAYDLATGDAARSSRLLKRLRQSTMLLKDKVELLSTYGFRQEAVKLLDDEINQGNRQLAGRLLIKYHYLVTTLGGFDELEDIFKPLLTGPHKDPGWRAQLGDYFVGQGEYQRAIPYLRTATVGGSGQFWTSLAAAYSALGSDQQAIEAFQNLLSRTAPDRVLQVLRHIGAQYETAGHRARFVRLLRLLANDPRYAGQAAPLLVEILAENGHIEQASRVVYDSTSRPSADRTDPQEASAVVDGRRDAHIQTLVGSLRALAGEGYLDEARRMLANLPAPLQADRRIKNLSLGFAIASSDETSAQRVQRAVAQLGLSDDDNQRRLNIAALLRRHGLYERADKVASKGMNSSDLEIKSATTEFLLANAFAADDIDRIDELDAQLVAESGNKYATNLRLAAVYRKLGFDQRALDKAVDAVADSPRRSDVLSALNSAQTAGNVDQLNQMLDLLVRVGKEPLSLIKQMGTRRANRQSPSLTHPLLNAYRKVHPADFDMRIAAIVTTFQSGQVEQGRADLVDLLETIHYDPFAVRTLVSRLKNAGLSVEIARVVAPRLDGKPTTPLTHRTIGLAATRLGLDQQADRAFQAYIQGRPDPALAATLVASELCDAKSFDKALTYANRAIRRKPNRPEAYFYRAEARLRRGNVQGARRDFDRSIGPGVNRPYGLYKAGYHALKAGRDDLARQYLTQLASSPATDRSTTGLRLAMTSFVDADRADAGVAFLEDRYPTMAAGKGMLGKTLLPQIVSLYQNAGQPKRAYELYESRLDEMLITQPDSPDLAVYWNNLAYIFAQTNQQIDRGFNLVRRAIATSTDREPSYLDTLGWLHYRRQHFAPADAYVRRSLHTSTSNTDGLTELVEHLVAIKRAQNDPTDTFWMTVFLDQ